MRNYYKIVFIFTALMLLGFGCSADDSPVSLDKYKIPETVNQEQQSQGQAQKSPQLTQINTPSSSQTDTSTSAVTNTANSLKPMAATSAEVGPVKEETAQKNMTNTQPQSLAFPGILPDERIANKQVHIKTSKGEIVFELLPKEGPKAASNFVYLAEQNFYDGLKFHRVVPNFVIQGGDPLSRNDDPYVGTGGPGYKFEDDKVNLSYKKGMVAMANSGPNTNGSQFFIMLEDDDNLPKNYSIFGRVISGMDVVEQIKVGDVMNSVTIEDKK